MQLLLGQIVDTEGLEKAKRETNTGTKSRERLRKKLRNIRKTGACELYCGLL